MDDVVSVKRAAFLIVVLAALAGCASLPLGCPAGLEPAATAELVFGRNIGGAEGVTDADWARFLDEEVTPRFPDGLSVFDAKGQWRGPSGVLVRERSKGLLLILSGDGDDETKLAAIRDAYKTRFKQDSVLLIRRAACVGF